MEKGLGYVQEALYLSSVIINGDGRNLQKDKHQCNSPPIWALGKARQGKASLFI